MSFSSYANLKTAIESWSHRNDVVSFLDDFIDLAEAEMWKHLELRDMEASATITTDTTRYAALPTNYLKPRRMVVLLSGNGYELQYVTPESLKIYADAGQPKYFTITNQIEFDRVPSGSFTVSFQYYYALTALSSSNTSNAVLASFPDIYLFGGLWALYLWAAQEEKSEFYYGKFMSAIHRANKMHKKGRHGPGAALRTEGPTP